MKHGKTHKSKLARYLQAAVVAGALASVALSGCSSSDEKRRASQLAGGCSLNSDCDKNLICAFERCHVPCKEDRDCLSDLRCVKSEETGVFVCQLESETTCKIDKDCPGLQTCGVDQECRDACTDDDDCVGDQVCALSNECASTVATKDKLDAEGNIVADDAAVGGNGAGGAPAANDGGMSSGGVPAEGVGGDDRGGSEATGGVEATGGAAGGDTSQAGADGGASSFDVEYEETSDGVETVPNDTREEAIPVTSAIRIYLQQGTSATGASSPDWFAYTAPDDGRAHIIIVRIEQDAALQTGMLIQAAEDHSEIFSGSLEVGTIRSMYVSVGPGTTTHFRFKSTALANSKGFALITFTDQREQDDNEPNNSMSQAKPITLGQSVTGQLLDPWQAESVDLSQDWFSVELVPGTVTFTFTALPSAGRAAVDYVSPGTSTAALLWAPAIGTPSADSLTVAEAGTYYFKVRPQSAAAVAGSSYNSKPAYFDEQYTFTVTQ